MQKQVPNPDGSLKYTNMVDCAQKTIKAEGITRLWAGLPTYIFRIGPHVMITLIASEFLKKKFK